jgi:hypothetical protein
MALGLVARKSFIPFVIGVAASLAQGCFTTKGDDDSTTKGCTKDTDCAAGRICNNGTCMNQDVATGGSSGSGSILSGGTGGSGTSSGGSGNAGTGGSKGGSGGSGNATGGTANAGSGGASTGGTSGMCSDSDPPTCPTADSMTFCPNGTETTLTCDYFCTTLGLTVGPCEDGYGCQCGDPTDQPCVDGVNAYCSCVSGSSQPCDSNDPANDPLSFYVECHANDPADQENVDFLKCLGMQLPANTMLSTMVCQNAAEACGATPPSGTGGTGGTGGSAGSPPTP